MRIQVLMVVLALAPRAGAAEKDAPAQVTQRLADALARGDADGAAALFEHTSTVMLFDGQAIADGWGEVKDHLHGALAGSGGHFSIHLASVERLDDGCAIARGTLWHAPQPDQKTLRGPITAVLRRSAAGWRIVHLHLPALGYLLVDPIAINPF